MSPLQNWRKLQERMNLPVWSGPALVVGAAALIMGGFLAWLLFRDATPPSTPQQAQATPTNLANLAPSSAATVVASNNPAATAVVVTFVASPTRPIPDCLEPVIPAANPSLVPVNVAPVEPSPTSAAPPDPLATIAPAGELLAHWPLAEAPQRGETADVSGHETNARLVGDVQWRPEEGPLNHHALAFGARGGVMDVSNPADNGYLHDPTPGQLVTMWVRPEVITATTTDGTVTTTFAITSTQTLYSEGSPNNGLRLQITDDHLEARMVALIAGQLTESEAAMPLPVDGEWHHVAADFNYGLLTLYLDGQARTAVQGSPIVLAGSEAATVGGLRLPGDNAINNPYRGLLADVRVYGSLTAPPPPITPTAAPTLTLSSALTATSPPASTLTSTPTFTLTPQPTATATYTATPVIIHTPEGATATTAVVLTPVPTAGSTATPSPTPTLVVITPSPIAPVVATPLPFGSQNIPLFDLPFPYDGGNVNFGGTLQQFLRAVQGVYNGGRITSFFDHQFPLYPAAFSGLEPAEFDGHMVTYAGILRETGYSGHPAYDFSPFEPRKPTTPLYAAASGEIFYVGIDTHSVNAQDGTYAHVVEIKHTVSGVGDFVSRYWHLEPDEHFDAMLQRIGQPIQAGERIGTIGNTGWSSGHHLHFEVRFDKDRDGRFEKNERVDPFGFIPLDPFTTDPWGEGVAGFVGPASPYLWKHLMGTAVQMPEVGGGQVEIPGLAVGGEGGPTLCITAGSLPPRSTINFSLIPDPPPSATLAGTGNGCVLSAFAPDGTALSRFDPPLEIYVPFELSDLVNIEDPQQTLALYWLPVGSSEYIRLPTEVDFERGVAYAQTDQPGHCALLGRPNRDLVAPVTTINVNGMASGGVFTHLVIVSLEAADDQSGIEYTEYSLDNGDTWQRYDGPFLVPASEQLLWPPAAASGDPEEGVIQGPGRYLVLAASRDNAGNVEVPPAVRVIVIDPRLGATSTPTLTGTPAVCPLPPGWVRYIVQAGDTFSRFVTLTNTHLEVLLRANCRTMDNTIIRLGQIIYLPFFPNPTATPGTPTPTGTLVTGTPATTLPRDLTQTAVATGTATVVGTTVPTATPPLPVSTPEPTDYPEPPPPTCPSSSYPVGCQ